VCVCVSGRNAFNNAATGADNLFCRARNVDSGVARALAIRPIYIHARRISAFLVLLPLVPGVRAGGKTIFLRRAPGRYQVSVNKVQVA
jgi:hypothetical protein